MFSVFIDGFGTVRAGIGGLLWCWPAGCMVMMAVHAPHRVPVPLSATAVQIVRPLPVFAARPATPLTVIEQVTSRPTLMMVRLAESSAGLGNSTSLLHGSTTLNSVCSRLPVST